MSEEPFYIKKTLKTHKGTDKVFDIHPVLYALIKGGMELQKNRRHFFGLITGGVGDGKTNIATLLAALWEKEHKRQLNLKDNFVWTTEKFTLKTDDPDNKTYSILWDEAIQGAGGKQMALTQEGELLKISLVTKRFKRHFYLLLVDEVEEYAWKLIKMCNFWIHVKTKGLERGYFDCYITKSKIKAIYRAFKIYKFDWSRITFKPDFVGRHWFYFDKLINEEEYNQLKIEETQVNKENKKDKEKQLKKETISKEDFKRYYRIKMQRDSGMKWSDIGNDADRKFFSSFESRNLEDGRIDIT